MIELFLLTSLATTMTPAAPVTKPPEPIYTPHPKPSYNPPPHPKESWSEKMWKGYKGNDK